MNPDGVVLDASVAVKWVIDEDFTEEARRLLRDSAGQPLVAPPHLFSKVTNALYQRLRRGDLTFDELSEALDQLQSFGISPLEPPNLYQEAATFARTNSLGAVYDSLYEILARQLGLTLWTADRRLLRAVGTVAPWVRCIGDYP